jgi:nicotinamide mononucleotide transporter
MNLIEVMGFLTGAVCVLLAVRQNIWNWPIGIANNIIYFVVFWRSKLYADACLQLVYIAISLYGWWKWLHKDASKHELTPTRLTSNWEVGALAAVTALSTVCLYFILHRFTDSTVPLGDATTTALSLTAQYMLSRKLIENWTVWMPAAVERVDGKP